MRLAESERRVMEVLWERGTMAAKEIAIVLGERLGWKKTTTYTMLTRCAEKGYIKREDPNFRCTAMVSKEEVSCWETDALLSSDFDNSADLLVASLIGRKKLTLAQMEKLYQSLRELEGEK